MKTRLLLLALLLSAPLFAFEPERIVIAEGEDFSRVERMLNAGWTVKSQSSVGTEGGGQYGRSTKPIHVFTLTPPTEAVKAELKAVADAARAAKAAEFQAKREAFLKARDAVKVEESK